MPRPLRVALVGARRTREGLGPFVARELRAAGAHVTAFVSTSRAGCAQARAELERDVGIRARGYLDLDSLLAAEPVDALAVCSPHEAHAAALERALERGLHALCEKPLVWGEGFGARTAAFVRRFAEREIVLFENCQWPHTLDAFAALHPGSLEAAPRRFRMSLQPAAGGCEMLADSLPHPLSLLQRLAPAAEPRIEAIAIDVSRADAADVRFDWIADSARVAVEVALRRTQARPRRTRIEIDGRVAERKVTSDYALAFSSGEREVPLPDPMAALVAEFVACAGAGRDPQASERGRDIAVRAAALERLVGAWPAAGAARG